MRILRLLWQLWFVFLIDIGSLVVSNVYLAQNIREIVVQGQRDVLSLKNMVWEIIVHFFLLAENLLYLLHFVEQFSLFLWVFLQIIFKLSYFLFNQTTVFFELFERTLFIIEIHVILIQNKFPFIIELFEDEVLDLVFQFIVHLQYKSFVYFKFFWSHFLTKYADCVVVIEIFLANEAFYVFLDFL